jgi:hypothetical protein
VVAEQARFAIFFRTESPGRRLDHGRFRYDLDRTNPLVVAPVSKCRDSNRNRIAYEARVQRTIEKYEFKLALMAEWEELDIDYYRKLKNEAAKLRQQLVVKGVL